MPTPNIFHSEDNFLTSEDNSSHISHSHSLKRGEFLKIIICLKITLTAKQNSDDLARTRPHIAVCFGYCVFES